MKLRHYTIEDKNKLLVFLPERINTTNIDDLEKSMQELIKENNTKELILEASELSYISSVGIRALLKLKKAGIELEIIRVKPEVEQIFTQVGIDTVIPVFSSNRVIYTPNLPVIMDFDRYQILKLDKERAVKVLKADTKKSDVLKEKNGLKEAFLMGVPTLIPYDYFRTTAGQYGLIFELPIANSYESMLISGKEDEDELIKSFVDTTKEIHSIEVPFNTNAVSKKESMIKELYALGILNEEEKKEIDQFYNAIPEVDTFLHTHLDFRNIVKNEEGDVLFTQIDGINAGHPVLDLYKLYYYHYLLPEYDMKAYQRRSGLEVEEGRRLTDKFMMSYFGLTEKEELEELYRQLRILSLIYYLEYANLPGKEKDSERDKALISEILDLIKITKPINF